MTSPIVEGRNTATQAYSDRLKAIQRTWWKRFIPVQAPYQWYLRRQRLGRTLEVGCGIGRNLASLNSESIGIDHNVDAVEYARNLGFQAVTTEEWQANENRKAESFDGLLLSHVLEHMTEQQAIDILKEFSVYLRPGGKVFIVCPQELGFRSDKTHVNFLDGVALTRIARSAGFQPEKWRSFPFPKLMGNLFIFNEFCLRASKPSNK